MTGKEVASTQQRGKDVAFIPVKLMDKEEDTLTMPAEPMGKQG